MSDLLDNDCTSCEWLSMKIVRSISKDGHTTKACFLSIVSYQPQAFRFILNDISSDGWVM
jgi:hypothetical protein